MDPEDGRLIVDRGAAAETITEEEFRAWARDQRVFISSVMEELSEERRFVADRVEEVGAEPVLFERFGGREDDAEAAYVHEVASSSVYVGILGRRYGRQLSSRYSATHAEYLAAEDHGLRVALWAKDVEDREGHEESFVQEVRTFHTTGRFDTPAELADDVDRRLRRIAAQDLAPWAKLGPVVFRARRITERAGRAEVVARVRDPEVLSRLEGTRSDRWGRTHEGTFTYSGRVRQSRVEDVEVTTTAGTGAEVHISLTTGELDTDPLGEMSLSSGGRTFSSAELTEIGLRRTLFGEPGPLDRFSESMSAIPDPFAPLRGLALSEEIIRPIAHLLLTEALVGGRRASRITRFRLGPPVAGARRFVLEWEAPRRYAGVEPERCAIDGVLHVGA
jgi:hypothetical protein